MRLIMISKSKTSSATNVYSSMSDGFVNYYYYFFFVKCLTSFVNVVLLIEKKNKIKKIIIIINNNNNISVSLDTFYDVLLVYILK